MIRRANDLLKGTVAALAIIGVVVGVPIALALAVGSPLPTGVPTASAVREALTSGGVDDGLVVKTVALLIWLAWTQVAAAFVLETVALLRGRPAPSMPGARSIQAGAARLIAATALISSAFTGLRATPASAQHAPIPLVASEHAPTPVKPDGARRVPTPNRPVTVVERARYEVARHDSLWSIAERTLGNGMRWREIRDLNAERPMTDGSILDPSSDTIQPGWILELPDGASPEHGELFAGTLDRVTVEVGDSLWSIAEDTATAAFGHEPTAVELHDHWRGIVTTNTRRLADPSDPGLVFAGQEILVPMPAPKPAPPIEPAVDPATTSEAVVATPQQTAAADPADAAPVATEGDANEHEAASRLGVAGAALASGLAAELFRRRRRRTRNLPPGQATSPPPPVFDEIRTGIALEADDDLVERRDGALRALGQALTGRHPGVRPRVIQASNHRVEVLLSSPAVPAPAPWQVQGGGAVWVCLDDLRTTPGANPAPALVAIGAPEDGGQLFLDLEAERVLTVTGDAQAGAGLVRSIVSELEHGASSRAVDLVLIDTDHLALGAAGSGATRWAEVADDLLARCEQATGLLQANQWRSAFHARAERGEDDGLTAVIAVVGVVPDDPRFGELCRRVTEDATTVSLIVLGSLPVGTRVVVDDGLVHIPALDLTCRAQCLDQDAAAAIGDLLDDDEPDGQLILLDELDPAPLRSVDSGEAGRWPPEVLVRLLGEIDVVGGRLPLQPKQTAVVAYIALHAPVSTERVQDAVWPAATDSRRKRVANTVSLCRKAIGAEHLPTALDGRFTIGAAVGTDLQEFERLTHLASQAQLADAIELLRAALELVRGPVFTYRSIDRASYVWLDLENWLTTWELKVINAALRLCDLALDADDVDTAIWAAERGLRSIPVHSALTEALMRGYWRRGDGDAAERVYLSHVTALEELDIDDVAETTIDLRDEIKASRPA